MRKALLLVLLIGAFSCAKAQLYGGVYYYIEAGQALTEKTTVLVVSLNGQTLKTFNWHTKQYVTNCLKQSSSYFEDYFSNQSEVYKYNSSLTTSSRVVYSHEHYIQEVVSYSWGFPNYKDKKWSDWYCAFSYDKSSLITWTQKVGSEEIEAKKVYTRIDKSEVMPNEHLYDFLDE